MEVVKETSVDVAMKINVLILHHKNEVHDEPLAGWL